MQVGIIGAGIAGLTLAIRLQDAGHSCVVLDKGRGVGGRTSTRRGEGVAFDHGAQYFTIRDPGFRAFLDRHVPTENLAAWEGRFAVLEGDRLGDETRDEARHVGVPGMNSVAQALAKAVEVRVGVTIKRLDRADRGWTLIDDGGETHGPFDRVVSTAPPVQSATLFEGLTAIADEARSVEMLPCFTLMVEPDPGMALPAVGIRCVHPVLGWISDNRSKPGRGRAPALVIQSNNEWAEAHVDDDRGMIAKAIREATANALGIDLDSARSESLHRWLYAKPSRPLGKPALLDSAAGLAACGDWCLAAKVEGAFLSGAGCAEILIGDIHRRR